MKHFRIHDAVARLSNVNLQSTVSVLNALYVVSKTLEVQKHSDVGTLFLQLERAIVPAAFSIDGELRGLRVPPDRNDVKGCYWVCAMVEERCPADMRLIQKDAPVELFLQLLGSKSQFGQLIDHQGD